ncbi:MAG: HAMP domain-containing sensor histidine kinase [Planctomycetota bacterium]
MSDESSITTPSPVGAEGLQEHHAEALATLRTELAGLERRLQASRDALQQGGETAALGVLTGLLAHEINNLLTPIGSYAQLALQRPDDEALRDKALQRAAHGAARGGRICEAILALARGTGDAASLRPEPDSNQAAAASVTAAWRSAIEGLDDGTGGAISLVLGKGLHAIGADVRARIGSTALEQILSNLALNASRATRSRWGDQTDRDGHLWLRIDEAGPVLDDERFTWNIDAAAINEMCQSPTNWLALVVSDNGVGMTPAQAEASLGQGHRSGPRAEGQGRGLGLSVCRELIAQAGGALGVASAPGAGAAFAAVLPKAA